MANLADKAAAQVKALRFDFTDRVRVITKYSDLDVEADLGGGLEILFSDFVSNDLLGGVVPSAHKQAVQYARLPRDL
jgi:hypothetical protein